MADINLNVQGNIQEKGTPVVKESRKVNNKPLSTDITLNAGDVGARPDTWIPTAADVGCVPSSRLVNGKPLSENINLNAAEVGAVSTFARPLQFISSVEIPVLQNDIIDFSLVISNTDVKKYLFFELILVLPVSVSSGTATIGLYVNNVTTAGSYFVSKYYGDSITTASSLVDFNVTGTKNCLNKRITFSPIELTKPISCTYPFFNSTSDFGIGMSMTSETTWNALTGFRLISSKGLISNTKSYMYLIGMPK